MSKEAIEFHYWMMDNDTPKNADKYFHWSDEDMFKEFLKQTNPTKENDIPHSEIRRMESEGVYEEKFDKSNSSSPTYFNDEWNKSHTVPQEFDEDHALDMVMNDMVKDWDTTLQDGLEDMDDESTYVDGIDERPIKKETEYNDDEFDY